MESIKQYIVYINKSDWLKNVAWETKCFQNNSYIVAFVFEILRNIKHNWFYVGYTIT